MIQAGPGRTPPDTAHATAVASEAPGKGEAARFQALLDELATAFVRIAAPEVDGEIEAWLQRLVEFFHADRSSLAELTPAGFLLVTHAWARPGYETPAGLREQDLPWLATRLRRGELYSFSSVGELPPEAVHERAHAQRTGIRSHVSVPLVLSGTVIGSFGIAWIQRARHLQPSMLQRLRLIGTVFGNALARKRAVQEHLQLSRTLEHAGRVATIGVLTSSFAHEITQPLGAALTNAQTALQLLHAAKPDLDELEGALRDIAADARRAGTIVHELRRFLRRHEATPAPLAVADLFGTVARFVSPEARNHGVIVEIRADTRLPAVMADRVQIQQVLVNLLLNAIDALQSQPAAQRRVLLEATPAGPDLVTLSVQDSGPGIPPQRRSNLFEPFASTKPDGLGIGLAISQTLVNAHGSRIAYTDVETGGARFSFTLATAHTEDPVG